MVGRVEAEQGEAALIHRLKAVTCIRGEARRSIHHVNLDRHEQIVASRAFAAGLRTECEPLRFFLVSTLPQSLYLSLYRSVI